jgi:hypothetical protein
VFDGLEVADGGSVGSNLDSFVGESDGVDMGDGAEVTVVGWGESRTDGASDGSEDGPEVFPVGLGVEAGSLVGGELGFKEDAADCEGAIVDKSDGDALSDASSLLKMLSFGFSEGAPEESRRLGSRLGLKDGVEVEGVEVEGVEVGRNEGASDALDGTVGVSVVRGYMVSPVLAWSMSSGNPEICCVMGSFSFFFDFEKTNPSERDTMPMTANVIPRDMRCRLVNIALCLS